jgi:hypothetical protein
MGQLDLVMVVACMERIWMDEGIDGFVTILVDLDGNDRHRRTSSTCKIVEGIEGVAECMEQINPCSCVG